MDLGLQAEVDKVLKIGWDLRDGHVVPETSSIALGNSGVEIDATVLYADLADSTELAIFNQQIAAEVYKAYLLGTTRIIRANGGQIRSFDGDRVMGVFIGDSKNTSAAKTALNINHFFTYILKPSFEAFYPSLLSSQFRFRQSVGIDTSPTRVARAGIRNNNDLVWVGRAPNIAAKLSSLREESFSSYISADVFERLHASSRFYMGTSMWELRSWAMGFRYGVGKVYRSSWWMKP